jgi:hypothetical protein
MRHGRLLQFTTVANRYYGNPAICRDRPEVLRPRLATGKPLFDSKLRAETSDNLSSMNDNSSLAYSRVAIPQPKTAAFASYPNNPTPRKSMPPPLTDASVIGSCIRGALTPNRQ